ncbi:MAG: outer membrane lipoprotein carrier protein LolA [Rhodospirillaceae bacterium]
MIGEKRARRLRRVAAAALALFAWAAPAQAARDITLSDRQAELVHKAEDALNRIHTLKARFLQAASTGEMAEGTVYLSRPGRLRVEYDPPTPVLVVANGAYFTFVDTKLKQLSYLGLDATPAGILLRKNVVFSGPDIRVRSVDEGPGVAEITLISKKDPTAGSLTLVFSLRPFALAQWRVTDAQGIATTVTLQNPETGVSLPTTLFDTPQAP